MFHLVTLNLDLNNAVTGLSSYQVVSPKNYFYSERMHGNDYIL